MLVSRWLPAVLCGVRSVFFDVVIRCYVMSRCIICYSLHYILHERNEFLNLFSARAYRISVGLVMSVIGDSVTLQWCDSTLRFAASCGGSEVFFFRRFLQLVLYFTHPVQMIFPRGKPEGNITQLLTPTHAQLQRHRLKFIKKPFKNYYMFRSTIIFRELQYHR